MKFLRLMMTPMHVPLWAVILIGLANVDDFIIGIHYIIKDIAFLLS